MNKAQVIFVIVTVGLSLGIPLILFPEIREALLFSYALTGLVILVVFGAVIAYEKLGEHFN